jgi:hypothetical protein
MQLQNTILRLVTFPLEQNGVSTGVPSFIYLYFENCEHSQVTITVSKAFLFWGKFKKILC